MTDCIVSKKCKLDWDLSKLTSLIKFKVSNSNLTEANVDSILNNLPESLKVLDVSLGIPTTWNVVEVKLTALEELRLERIVVLENSPLVEAVFEMEKLKSVHISESFLGRYIPEKLPNHNTKWTDFSLKYPPFDITPLENLLSLKNLTNLGLISTGISATIVVNFITANLASFPSSKSINLSGHSFDQDFLFADALVEKGIKIQFDNYLLPLTDANWRNYCLVSTGIPIGLTDSILAAEQIGKNLAKVEFLLFGFRETRQGEMIIVKQ
jgi:hypothetical protein